MDTKEAINILEGLIKSAKIRLECYPVELKTDSIYIKDIEALQIAIKALNIKVTDQIMSAVSYDAGYREGCAETWRIARELFNDVTYGELVKHFDEECPKSVLDKFDPDTVAKTLQKIKVERGNLKTGDIVINKRTGKKLVVVIPDYKEPDSDKEEIVALANDTIFHPIVLPKSDVQRTGKKYYFNKYLLDEIMARIKTSN